MSERTITLTTDYGTRDWYVGALKGVLSSIAPEARLVDITHEIGPQDVRHGAFVLWRIWPCFPRGTVHLVVVDPGVGTNRRILAGSYEGQLVVAPDNGLVTFVEEEFERERMQVVENAAYFREPVSATFHGRDIMAPVAAHLACGVDVAALGRSLARPEVLGVGLRARREGNRLCGQVVHVDRFGTLVSNIRAESLAAFHADAGGEIVVSVGGVRVGTVRSTFADVSPGGVVAVVGGSGLLEVAVNQGRAVDRFGAEAVIEVESR